jgi:DNA-binding protein H-NS
MTKINGLGTMTYAQLLELRDRVDTAILAAKAAEKRELRVKMETLAAKAGLTLADVFDIKNGTGTKTLRGTKVGEVSQSKDSTQTWAGQGRKPNWLAAAIKKGQKIESFRV